MLRRRIRTARPSSLFRRRPAAALAEHASALIVAHNHPNGTLEPSDEDLQVTRKLKEVAGLLGLNLLDHIIFNAREYYSLAEHGEL